MNGLDYTKQTTPEMCKIMKSLGIEYVGRYMVPEKGTSYLNKFLKWKRLTPEEVKVLSDAGIKILSCFETTADSPKYGATRGELDGMYAYKEAKLLGQPEGSAIYFCCDWDAQPADYDKIEMYFKAASLKIPGYEIGVYGSYNVVEEMYKRGACKHFWQTRAWSYGKISRYANLHQIPGATIDGLGSVDKNESFGNEGLWSLKGVFNGDRKEIMDWNKANADFVKKFQTAFGLEIDGQAGNITNKKLDEVIKNVNQIKKIKSVLEE